MYSKIMNCDLDQLFNMMNGEGETGIVRYPDTPCRAGFTFAGAAGQGDLFSDACGEGEFSGISETDVCLITGLHSAEGVDLSALPENARRLFELSANAFDAVVQAWMSELPISAEIIRFGGKVLAAADVVVSRNQASGSRNGAEDETAQRQAAERAASDRGDPDVRAVLGASYKVWHEIDRLRGLLRFCPDENGVYIARCEPDHFVLPALGPHFSERFGQTPWIIIDEKRRLVLRGTAGGQLEFGIAGEGFPSEGKPVDDGKWGDLWRHYHKTINNESRNNPGLQRRFMPKRYWKYLTELFLT